MAVSNETNHVRLLTKSMLVGAAIRVEQYMLHIVRTKFLMEMSVVELGKAQEPSPAWW